MPTREITIILTDLLDAMNESDGDSYLNLRTGEIATLHPDDRWREIEVAEDARNDMDVRPNDWVRMPTFDLDGDDGQRAFAEWTYDLHLLPTVV